MPEAFQCTLITPEAQVLDAQVVYASIPAHDGQLGVAHLRAPIVTKLGDGPLRLDYADGESKRYFIGGGFAQIKDDKLVLLTEEAIPAEKIDAAAAKTELTEALATVALSDDEVAAKDRKTSRARAMSHLAE